MEQATEKEAPRRFRDCKGTILTFDPDQRLWSGGTIIVNADDFDDWPMNQFGERIEGAMLDA